MSNQPTFTDKLQATPLLRVLVPMVAGIVTGTFVVIPLYAWIVGATVCGVMARLGRKRKTATLYLVLTILFFGAALARAGFSRPVVLRGERVWMEVVLTDNPTRREGWRSASSGGTVTRWQPDDRTDNDFTRHRTTGTSATSSVATLSPSGEWLPAGEKVLVSLDTVLRFAMGDRVVFRGYINPIVSASAGYLRLMRVRGYTGRTYISRYSHPSIAPAKVKTPGILAKKLQSAATERLRRLDGATADSRSRNSPFSGAMAVAAAMTTGDRSGITPELRGAYSRIGASHLLAVSGLHVGIVFMIVNTLLYLLPLFPRGHTIKNIAAIVAIWFYATLTGLSPSATRAAFMFTGAQIALATSQTRGTTNIMCGTALVMLAMKPALLFDVSFQLSFLAVASILAWFSPLYRLVESGSRLLNALWATLITGFTASLATMPLASHIFGVFSPAGIVLNPLVIVTAYLIVAFSLIWIAAPVPFSEPLFRWLIGVPASIQNRTVELVSSVPGATIEWTMPLWGVFATYAAITTLTVWYYARPHRREPFVLPR